MADFPLLNLHIREFLADTFWLSTEEIGAYFRLLCRFHETGMVPKQDDWPNITGISSERLRPNICHISAMFEVDRRDGSSPAIRAIHGTSKQRTAIPLDVKRAVRERDGAVCVYCGDKDGPFDLDHKVPWSRGGKHTKENLVVACRHCNRSKGALTASEWRCAS